VHFVRYFKYISFSLLSYFCKFIWLLFKENEKKSNVEFIELAKFAAHKFL